ncbi:hypothetical protein [Nocardiopsis ansamitocini]|uniref:Transmembrane protein n=1 Tax=Nocardiopsis ansamitocini TaxID=1670832 RepID=A0A9W6P8I3_9ACTN|nr:hypothetical protein [Nocardiopsis ansamitocini]GLU48999.1 hypothetical protein Nans01_33500 [Nocardiopsis ansamitocini]
MIQQPFSPPQPLTPQRVVSRTLGTVLLLAAFAGGAVLPFMSIATVMQPASCTSVADAPACNPILLVVALLLPWAGWLAGVVGGLVMLVVSWRRRRGEWLWGALALVVSASSAVGALLVLFGPAELLTLL